jgi:hypothetical protein
MNPQTITTEELLALTKSADLLRQTAEQALRCDSLARELHNVRNDRDHLAGILEKVARVFDDPDEGPSDFHQLPQAVEGLRLKCESLKGEVVTAGNHAACRLNVLKDIHRILGTDGLSNEANTLTGVPSQLARLPKRIGQLLADVTTWRGRYNMMIAENGELVREMDERVGDLVRENETLARNMPPEPPSFHETAIHEMQDRIVRKTAEAWLQDAPYRRTFQKPHQPPPLMEETPVVMTYDPVCFRTTKILGQAWCKTDRATNSAIRFNMHNDCIVLCDVHQDTTTGALTYVPVSVDELPQVTNAAAS